MSKSLSPSFSTQTLSWVKKQSDGLKRGQWDSAWFKKEGDEDFDIPMGCYDDAETCELVGIYIQNKL